MPLVGIEKECTKYGGTKKKTKITHLYRRMPLVGIEKKWNKYGETEKDNATI